MKKGLSAALCFIGLVYGGITFLMVFHGLNDASGPALFDNCDHAFRRIEYAFPGYRIGCWLGQDVQ